MAKLTQDKALELCAIEIFKKMNLKEQALILSSLRKITPSGYMNHQFLNEEEMLTMFRFYAGILTVIKVKDIIFELVEGLE